MRAMRRAMHPSLCAQRVLARFLFRHYEPSNHTLASHFSVGVEAPFCKIAFPDVFDFALCVI
jgi:hypothetical protein